MIDRCHFLVLGICLSKGCRACAGETKHLLSVCLLYISVNYVSYLFKLSDATTDCSACCIKAFCCDIYSLVFNCKAYFLSISISILCNIISAMARTALYPNVSDLNFREVHNATSSVEDTIAWLRQQGLLATHRPCNVCGKTDFNHTSHFGRLQLISLSIFPLMTIGLVMFVGFSI